MTDASLPIEPTPVDAPPMKTPPTYPDGADLLVRAATHDEQFWDRHPRVERYRVVITPERVDDAQQQVLVWLKPAAEPVIAEPALISPPDRPADLDIVFDTVHEAALLADHPDVIARQDDLEVNAHADGAERRLRLWLRKA